MPRGDSTGPMGMGPMTGRGAGFCAGSGMPGYANFGPGRGYWGRGGGGGRGMYGGRGGRGWRHWFYATGLPGWQRFGAGAPIYAVAPGAEAETDMLRNQAEFFKSQLAGIEKRLGELEQRPES
jgi:hypothetical protein